MITMIKPLLTYSHRSLVNTFVMDNLCNVLKFAQVIVVGIPGNAVGTHFSIRRSYGTIICAFHKNTKTKQCAFLG
jgi:hypothetical protein